MRHRLCSAFMIVVLLSAAGCGARDQRRQPPAATASGAAAPADASGRTPPAGAADAAGAARVDRARLSAELAVLTSSEPVPQKILDLFAAEYGIRVTFRKVSSDKDLLNSVRSGGSAPDLVVLPGHAVKALAEEGLLSPLNKSNIPNAAHLDPRRLKPPFDPDNRYSLPYLWGTRGLIFNTGYVTETVDSWRVLWNPEYRGRVVLQDDPRDVIGLGLRMLGYSYNETDRPKIEEAEAKVKEMLPNVRAFLAESPRDMLVSGEAWLAQVESGEAARILLDNPNFQYVIPREGGVMWMDNWAVPKAASRQYTAEVFINFLNRPNVARLFAEAVPYGSPNAKGLRLADPRYRNNRAAYAPEDWLKRTEWLQDVGEAAEWYAHAMDELKASR